MASYKVDLSGLADAAVQLNGVSSRLEQAVYDLKARVAQFMSVNQGQAIENYAEVQNQWDTGLGQVREGNAKATGALRMIADNYDAGDRQGAALFVA